MCRSIALPILAGARKWMGSEAGSDRLAEVLSRLTQEQWQLDFASFAFCSAASPRFAI